MKVGLLADTHDRLPAIAELLRRFSDAGADVVLHAGDYCAPFALAPFMDAQIPVAGVFGRNDGDRRGLEAKAAQGIGIELFESPHSFEIGGRRLLIVHDIGEVQDRSLEAHQVVIHGCSHLLTTGSNGDALVINPGEGCGWITGTPTGVILDLDSLESEVVRLDGPEWAF